MHRRRLHLSRPSQITGPLANCYPPQSMCRNSRFWNDDVRVDAFVRLMSSFLNTQNSSANNFKQTFRRELHVYSCSSRSAHIWFLPWYTKHPGDEICFRKREWRYLSQLSSVHRILGSTGGTSCVTLKQLELSPLLFYFSYIPITIFYPVVTRRAERSKMENDIYFRCLEIYQTTLYGEQLKNMVKWDLEHE